jgi:hypothetical protein
VSGDRDRVAFGFRLRGVPPRSLLVADEPGWPKLHVRGEVGSTDDTPAHIGERTARLSLGGGDWLALDRDAATATYLTTAPLDADALVHPRLAPAAALMARWHGREAFHAGALLAGGGAWALAGANEAGKSTLLASLAIGGTAVLTDDLLVVDGAGLAYAGPRCIDLRSPVLVGDGDDSARLRPVREATRLRMDLAAAPVAAPLRGWIHLEWGDAVEARPCPAADRLGRLLTQRRWAAEPIDPRALLDLAALPTWTLRRPRGAEHMPAVLALLRELTGEAPTRPARPQPAAA